MKWKAVRFEWNNIRAFLVTVEEGTLTAAAKALGITQPTLSRQVAALEKELGVTLFERLGQRLVLTQSGMELLEHARSMGEAAIQFSLTATGQSQELQGSVVISVGELDAIYRLPNVLQKIREEYPSIDIEILVTNETSDLKRREADIAIRSFRPTQSDLIARKLGEETIQLYGHPNLVDRYMSSLNIKSPGDIQIIGYEQNKPVVDLFKQNGWCVNNNNFRLITQFQQLQIELAKQRLGLVFLPQSIGNNINELVPSFEEELPPFKLPLWLVCHQELRTNLRVRKVFDLLAENLSGALIENHKR